MSAFQARTDELGTTCAHYCYGRKEPLPSCVLQQISMFLLPPNEFLRKEGERRAVRHLAWKNYSKEPDVSQGADRDIATQAWGHWPAIASPGSESPVDLGEDSTPRGKGKKLVFKKSSNHQNEVSPVICLLLLFMSFWVCLALFLFCHTNGFNFTSHVLYSCHLWFLLLEPHLESLSQTSKLCKYFLFLPPVWPDSFLFIFPNWIMHCPQITYWIIHPTPLIWNVAVSLFTNLLCELHPCAVPA